MRLYHWSLVKVYFVLGIVEILCHCQQASFATQLNIVPFWRMPISQMFLMKFIYAAPIMLPFKGSQIFYENLHPTTFHAGRFVASLFESNFPVDLQFPSGSNAEHLHIIFDVRAMGVFTEEDVTHRTKTKR